MIKKLRDEWYSYLIVRSMKKKRKLEKKIHHYIYKKFGWNEEEDNEELWDFSCTF